MEPEGSLPRLQKPVTFRYPVPDKSSTHSHKIYCSMNNLCHRCQSSWQYAGCKSDVFERHSVGLFHQTSKNSEAEWEVFFCVHILCKRNALLSRNPLSSNIMLVSLGQTCKAESQSCAYRFSSSYMLTAHLLDAVYQLASKWIII